MPDCKYCNDEGYIYTCLNCHKPAIYDYQLGIAVCDDCFILGDEQNIVSEKCDHCNAADLEVEIPKVGQKILRPSADQIEKLITWLLLMKIKKGKSYDVLKPIKLENGMLTYYSYVDNKVQHIENSRIQEIEVRSGTISSIKWSTNLKGLIEYLKEDRNHRIIGENKYVRLVFFTGCSWDANTFDYHNVAAKKNVRESHFVNGLTLNLKTLLKGNMVDKFPHIKSPNDSFYFDSERNTIYLIESISKFETF